MHTYSSTALDMTKAFEGLRLTAYRDCAGVLTIGFGHTGPDVHEGQTITEAEAEKLLLADLAPAIRCVNDAVKVPLTQGQFDALVDFVYNAGRGNFLRSTLLVKLNSGDYAGAAEQFMKWVYAGGQVEEGLVRRRAAEVAMFRGEVAHAA